MEKSKIKTMTITLVAIFTLIAITIGTTYAFFTYYRTGSKNQVILTGRIKLVFADGDNAINLTNQFPISDADAMSASFPYNQNDVELTDFTVTGYATGIELGYKLTAIAGSAVTGRNRMPDNKIKLYLTESHGQGEGSTTIQGFGYHSGSNYGALASTGNDGTDTGNGGEILLATGTVGENESVHNYVLRMWISDDVTISDTDSTATYCASANGCLYNKPVFSTLYYSLKLVVQDDMN